jgi:hypothetical protein
VQVERFANVLFGFCASAVLVVGLLFGADRAERAWVDDGNPGVVLAGAVMAKRRLAAVQIATVSDAVAIMGGDTHVARFLGVHRAEITRMRRGGAIDRGFFAQFFITLTRLGYEPAPALFGLRSWDTVTVPGGKSARPSRRVA